MRGRKPTPTELFLLRGKPSHSRRANPLEPKPPPAFNPEPPRWIGKQGAAAWTGLVRVLGQMKILTEADLDALALLCAAYDDFLACRATIQKDGRTYESTNLEGQTIVRGHPAVRQMADAWGCVKSMMLEFGLTPSSRSRLAATAEAGQDPLERYLARGKPTLKST